MSAGRQGKSSAAAWTVAFILWVPLLYLLTLPLIIWLNISDGMVRRLQHGSDTRPRWVKIYCRPCALIKDTPLEKPFVEYIGWWYLKLKGTQ